MPERNILVKNNTNIKKKRNAEGNPWKSKNLKNSCNAPIRNAGSLRGSIKASLLVITCIFLLFVLSLELHFYSIALHSDHGVYFQKNWKFSLKWLLRSTWISLILVTVPKEMNTSCQEQGNFPHTALNFIFILFHRELLKMASRISHQ